MPRDHFGNLPIVAGMTFSRDVLLLDDCEGTFTWAEGGTGGDDVHEYLAAAAFSGTAGMHLKTRTTGAAADDILSVSKYVGYPETGLLITRLRVALPDKTKVKQITISVNVYNGSQGYNATLEYTPADGKVYYTNSAASVIEIAALANTHDSGTWVIFELALDLKGLTYLHALVNGLRADLSAQGLYGLGADVDRHCQLSLSVIAIGANAAELYAANLVVHEIPEA